MTFRILISRPLCLLIPLLCLSVQGATLEDLKVRSDSGQVLSPSVEQGTGGEVPRLGKDWTARSGESLKRLADFFYPSDRAARVRFVTTSKKLNPELHVGAYDKIQAGTIIKLPGAINPPVAAQSEAPTLLPENADRKHAQSPEEQMRILDERARAADEKMAEFKAQEQEASGPPIDRQAQIISLQHAMESQDQNLAQVNEQLNALTPASNKWLWRLLITGAIFCLTCGGAAVWIWTRHQNRKMLGVTAMDLQTIVDFERGRHARRQAISESEELLRMRLSKWREESGLDALEISELKRQYGMDEHEELHKTSTDADLLDLNIDSAFSNPSESTKVNEAGTLTEVVNMLLEAGFVDQAIATIKDDIEQYPDSISGWMRLFEIYQARGQRKEFVEAVHGFRSRFKSDGIWRIILEMSHLMGVSVADLEAAAAASANRVTLVQSQHSGTVTTA